MGRNLTNLPISASFQYLLQVSGSDNDLNDGLGNDVDLITVTASYATQALSASYAENATVDTGSLMTTGSVTSNTLTFTKGDGSTFDLTVDTGSAPTFDTGSLLTTASAADATITFTKGDATTFDVTVDNVTTANTASYVAGANVDGAVATATSASHAVNADSAITASHAESLKSNIDISVATITASNASFDSASIGYLETITGSATIIGDAFVVVNTATPASRYAGIKVEDSGSTPTDYTASLIWDSVNNDWFYEYTGSDDTDYAVAMFGPEYGTKGSPTYLTNNRLAKGDGGHHLNDSTITDDGTLVSIDANVSASGYVSASEFVGDGSKLTGIGTSTSASAVLINEKGDAVSYRMLFGPDAGASGVYSPVFHDSDGNFTYNPSTNILEVPTIGTSKIQSATLTISSSVLNVISGSTTIHLASDSENFNVQNPDEKLAMIVRGGIMAGSDESLSTDPGFNNHLFGERITAAGSTQTCGTLAGREVDFGGNSIEYSAFIATQNGTFDGSNRSAIIGGTTNTIDTEDSLGTDNVIITGQSNRIGAGERNVIAGGNNNEIVEGKDRAVIGGKDNTLGYDSGVAEYSGSVIIGGNNNLSKHNNVVILGGNAITSSAHDTVYAPNLHISSSGGTLTFPDGTTQTTAATGGTTFPYTGSAIISGSLIVTGSVDIQGQVFTPTTAVSVASSTASIDFADSNFQTLNASAGSIHIDAPTNIKSGTTYTLIITSGSGITGYASTFKFSEATQPTFSGGTDILTMVSDGTNLYGTGLANFS